MPTNTIEQSSVQVSTDYDQFKLISNNREPNRGHIENLKAAFEEIGNLTVAQPILVNENMEIVDGQHRFIAAKELEQPIYYIQREGLRIHDARVMNILHRNWTDVDFAKSYADGGNEHYQKYIHLRELFPTFGHATVLAYVNNGDYTGRNKEFRAGDMVIGDYERTKTNLDRLAEIYQHTTMAKTRVFSYAMLQAMNRPGYDHNRMVRKTRLFGDRVLHLYQRVGDMLRCIEDLYNHQAAERNRVRFF